MLRIGLEVIGIQISRGRRRPPNRDRDNRGLGRYRQGPTHVKEAFQGGPFEDLLTLQLNVLPGASKLDHEAQLLYAMCRAFRM